MDTNKPSAGINQGYLRPVPGLRQCRSAPAKNKFGAEGPRIAITSEFFRSFVFCPVPINRNETDNTDYKCFFFTLTH